MSRIGMLAIGLIAASALIVACETEPVDDDPFAPAPGATSPTPSDGLASPTPTVTEPSPTPADGGGGAEVARPPEAELDINGMTYRLMVGSYCWSAGDDGAATCEDHEDVVVATERAEAMAGDTVTISFRDMALTGDDEFEIDNIRLWKADEEASDSGIDWEAFSRDGDEVDLDLQDEDRESRTFTLPDDLEPGLYLLEIEVSGGGDNHASYGAIIDVR